MRRFGKQVSHLLSVRAAMIFVKVSSCIVGNEGILINRVSYTKVAKKTK